MVTLSIQHDLASRDSGRVQLRCVQTNPAAAGWSFCPSADSDLLQDVRLKAADSAHQRSHLQISHSLLLLVRFFCRLSCGHSYYLSVPAPLVPLFSCRVSTSCSVYYPLICLLHVTAVFNWGRFRNIRPSWKTTGTSEPTAHILSCPSLCGNVFLIRHWTSVSRHGIRKNLCCLEKKQIDIFFSFVTVFFF